MGSIRVGRIYEKHVGAECVPPGLEQYRRVQNYRWDRRLSGCLRNQLGDAIAHWRPHYGVQCFEFCWGVEYDLANGRPVDRTVRCEYFIAPPPAKLRLNIRLGEHFMPDSVGIYHGAAEIGQRRRRGRLTSANPTDNADHRF